MLNEENYFVDNAELTGTDCYLCHKEIKGSPSEGKPRACIKCNVNSFIKETQEKPVRKLGETDMKKDLEWLVQRIHSEQEYLAQSFAEGKETDEESSFNDGKDKALSGVMRLINELDEPETLSQEWVEEHTWNNHYIGRPFVYVDDIQEVLVPKHEKVKVPRFVADYIEMYKEQYGLFTALLDVRNKNNENANRVAKWLLDNLGDIEEPLAELWLDGYTVEVPKRYRIKVGNIYMLNNSKYTHKKEEAFTYAEDGLGKAEADAKIVGGVVEEVEE